MALVVDNISVRYGDSLILDAVGLSVEKEGAIALIGANGAGKTTLLKAMMGLVPLSKGRILLDGRDITREPPEARAGFGIAMVPEGRRLFQGLTVEENLLMGAFGRMDRQNIPADLERLYGYFPELVPLRRQLAGTLSGGQQQMCAIARALIARPTYLLVDEMSLGLSPLITERLAGTLVDIRKRDRISLLVVDQDVELALEMADAGYVLQTGAVVASGPAAELLATADIQQAYMGLEPL